MTTITNQIDALREHVSIATRVAICDVNGAASRIIEGAREMIEDSKKLESVRELRLDELKSVGGGFTTGSGVSNTGFGAMWLTKALKFMTAPSA